jgi:hypothetical protein
MYIGNIIFIKKVLTSKKMKKSDFPNKPERLEKQKKQILGLRQGTDCRKQADELKPNQISIRSFNLLFIIK